jgi:hypothetical protein
MKECLKKRGVCTLVFFNYSFNRSMQQRLVHTTSRLIYVEERAHGRNACHNHQKFPPNGGVNPHDNISQEGGNFQK